MIQPITDNETYGIIDETTPLGRIFELTDGKYELISIDGDSVIMSHNKGEPEIISLEKWNAEYVPKCEGFIDPLGAPEQVKESEPLTQSGTAEHCHKMTVEQESVLFAMQDKIKEAKEKEVEANEYYKGLKKRREALEAERDEYLDKIQHGGDMPLFENGGVDSEPSSGPACTNDENWRNIALETLPEISPDALTALANHEPSITTIGELVDWQTKKGEWWVQDIYGLGEVGAETVNRAMENFWISLEAKKRADAQS